VEEYSGRDGSDRGQVTVKVNVTTQEGATYEFTLSYIEELGKVLNKAYRNMKKLPDYDLWRQGICQDIAGKTRRPDNGHNRR
jgi:hypothetical protein